MMNVTVRGIKKLKRDLKAEGARAEKAMVTAVKVEAFRLSHLMKKEIRQGAPGGRRFAPLTYLSRRISEKRLRPNKPLRALANAVRYHVADRNPLDVRVGFTGPRVSSTWKRIAEQQQEGFTHAMHPRAREMFAWLGGRMSTRAPSRKYMFLRKDTREFTTPARPIIEPFWDKHRSEALFKIRDNFRRKMKGKRI